MKSNNGILLSTTAMLLLACSNTVHPQPLMPGRGFSDVVDRCANAGVVGDECLFSLEDYTAARNDEMNDIAEDLVITKNEDDEEEDPMLKLIPGTDFKAYVRADVSTFYRDAEPGSDIREQTPSYQGQASKFVNLSPEPLREYWVGPNGAKLQSDVAAWGASGTASFPSHEFTFNDRYNASDVKVRFKIVKGTSVYFYDPYVPDDPDDPSQGVTGRDTPLLDLNSLSAEERAKYDQLKYNLEFGKLYKNFTGGSEWLALYPRDPPRNKIWRADYFGQEHRVASRETQFLREPPAEDMHRLSADQMRRDNADHATLPLAEYRAPGVLNLTITALSVAPRIFEIRNFLSDVEVDHILGLVRKKQLARSTTNGHMSDTRTSSTTWLPRSSDRVVDAVFRRVADALRLDEALLRRRQKGEVDDLDTLETISEDLQIVHYDVGQQYTAHHDFGYRSQMVDADSPTRSINLCMYLNDVPAGGQTSFPRWRNGETTDSLDVIPEKGKAVIFYMINQDGNLDDLSQHAALPVLEGEKYFANLWIWNPRRSAL